MKPKTPMTVKSSNILISGAGIAGPIAAYWLGQFGFSPTVVERAPALRVGGHPVDLWGSAVEVVKRMGVLSELEATSTRNDVGVMLADGQRPVEIDLKRLVVEIADQHIEIMRGRLVSVLYERTKADVEYLFGNSIIALDEHSGGVRASFERGAPREFALVIGADGQHSNVRRLTFGEEASFSHYIGGYICGSDSQLPESGRPDSALRGAEQDRGRLSDPAEQRNGCGILVPPRRAAGSSITTTLTDKSSFCARSTPTWAGRRHACSAISANAATSTSNSFSQIRMDTWSRGRITLVGDAGYGPAPAVGGGTRLAAVAAYVLARELAEADGDYLVGLRSYQNAIQNAVIRSRDIGPAVVNTLIPRSRFAIWLGQQLAPLVLGLPRTLQQWLPLLPRKATGAMRAISAIPLGDAPKSLSIVCVVI